MNVTLVCWSCKAEKQTEVAESPMFAFEVGVLARDIGWKSVIDIQHGRYVVFCSDECQAYQTTKGGGLRARPKPVPNARNQRQP